MANEFVVRNGIKSLGGITYPLTGINASYSVGENDYLIDVLMTVQLQAMFQFILLHNEEMK